jgi:heptosyltransferase-1
VIDAQGLIKSAVVARLLSKHCAGFDKHSIRESAAAWLYKTTVAYPYDANTIDRNVAVLTQPLGISVSQQQIIDKQPFLFYQPAGAAIDDYLIAGQQQVLLVIGSTWPSRNYSKQQDGEWIAERSNAKLLPRLNLNDLKALIAKVDLVIGNDTGPTHMAWGLNRPSITLFGPTPISRVYQTPINLVLKSPSIVNPFKLDKNDFSIKDIEAGQVLACARGLLAE